MLSDIFELFAFFFVLAKLATSSIRVNHEAISVNILPPDDIVQVTLILQRVNGLKISAWVTYVIAICNQ